MRILQVSAELFPLLKTGGLADVAGALPLALMAEGKTRACCCRAFRPSWPGVRDLAPVAEFNAPWGERFGLRFGYIAIDGSQADRRPT
jgi:starch synthase